MSAARLTRMCGCMAGQVMKQTVTASIVNRGLMTSAVRLKREITVIEPDRDDNRKSVAKTDKHGKLAELNDPFDLKIVARGGEGTKDSPDLIPSMFNRRIVGHICEEDQSHITWFYLYKGEPQKCQCGHWFKLVPVDPL